MRTLTAFLWVIIIAGATLIVFTFLSPRTAVEIPEVITETPPVETSTQTTTPPTQPTETISSPDYNGYLAKGKSAYEQGDYITAITNFENAVKTNPNSTIPLLSLAQSYTAVSQYEKALNAYLKAETLSPENLNIKSGTVHSLLNLRRIEDAKNYVWKLPENLPQVAQLRGEILILYKDFPTAKKEFKQAGETAQKYLDAFNTFEFYSEAEQVFLQLLLAKSLAQNHQFESAIPLLFDIITQKNNYRDAWIVLGYCYLATNKPQDAIDSFLKAKALDSTKPETLFYLGLAYFSANDLKHAEGYLKQADKAGYTPKDQLNLKLGDIYLIQQEFQKSAQSYEKVIAANPGNLDIFIRAIWLNIEKLNTPINAIALANIAVKYHPDQAMSYNLVGWANTAAGNYDLAEKYLTQALNLQPNFDAAFLNFGWYYEKQGNTTLAKQFYEKAFSVSQGTSIAALASTRLKQLSQPELDQYFSSQSLTQNP